MTPRQIGLVGLGTMGRALAMNLADHEFAVSAWNLEPVSVDDRVTVANDLPALVATLTPPRTVLIMIQAGEPVDQVVNELVGLLEPGDLVVDGGNSNFRDTIRRAALAADQHIEFAGMGVSGGEEGARHGPSLMFGGSTTAWEQLGLERIAAHSDWGPCARRIGPDGAGHFVKMVHNGIEYADMQVIAEIYDLARRNGEDLVAMFRAWNDGPLQSFLVELTANVLERTDPATGAPLVDAILDVAEQKGTGRWTVATALELGVAVPSIAAGVDARALSARPDRSQVASVYPSDPTEKAIDTDVLHGAMHAAKLCAYAQGLQLIAAGSAANDWAISIADVAKAWTGGCIIRARILNDVVDAYTASPELSNLLLHDPLVEVMAEVIPRLRETVTYAANSGIPAPAMSASLAWFDAVRSSDLPQNLIQAQRDVFGAHTYRRKADPDKPIHTDWFA